MKAHEPGTLGGLISQPKNVCDKSQQNGLYLSVSSIIKISISHGQPSSFLMLPTDTNNRAEIRFSRRKSAP